MPCSTLLCTRFIMVMEPISNRILGIPWVVDLQESPPTKSSMVVYCGYPEEACCSDFCLLVFLLFTGHLDNQVQQFIFPLTIIKPDQEIRDIVLFLPIDGVRNAETDIVILCVSEHLFHIFQASAIFCSHEPVSATT